MMFFWLICAGLVAIALAFVLPPLLERPAPETADDGKHEANLEVYRDQLSELEADLQNGIISAEQYQQDRDEIERRLLDEVSPAAAKPKKGNTQARSRRLVYAIALGLPVIAVVLYLRIGNSAAMSGAAPTAAPVNSSPQATGQMSQQQIEANVATLAQRMEQNPGDAEGWIMLGRSYMTLNKYSEAADAYAKASTLKTDDPDLLADYAFAMAMVNNRQLKGEPFELVKKALRIEPQNAKALDL
ncbi:MAG: c-type cytochrome biogenesis protein CcmI, partial [Acidobacteria bacterium]|nr:c-type cytochrome biogenesis protein CcmI [Acidobacteriota bacterium]